ncbi:hypothetical protein [Microbacterium sp. NPDC096154]|uniref:hypothetical protein n=1 Tax=Microbacterium sp. NPDC096154 TaxID=3155549 RepID=UPI00331B61CD
MTRAHGRRTRGVTWARALAFAAAVYVAPLAVGAAAALLLDRTGLAAPSLVGLAAIVAAVGALVLAVIVRRRTVLDVPGLALSAAASGFAASGLVGLLLPAVGLATSGAFGAALGGLAFYGMMGLLFGPMLYLIAAGPIWLASSALGFARIILPRHLAGAQGRTGGVLFAFAGVVLAATTIGMAVADAARGSLADRCAATAIGRSLREQLDTGVRAGAYDPAGELSWFPLGLRCEWEVAGQRYVHDPDWLATLCVVWALALLALGIAMLVRARRPAPRRPRARAVTGLGGPEDPWTD